MSSLQCDWSLGGSDLRAFVQSQLAELDRCGVHIQDVDKYTADVAKARAELNARFSMYEYRAAKERMHTRKAVGIDGIPFELLRGSFQRDEDDYLVLISELDEVVLHVFNTVLASGKYPDAWRLAVLVPLLKGTGLESLLPTNYRGIALLSSLSKLFANMLEHRLSRFQSEVGLISDSSLVSPLGGGRLTQHSS